MNTVHKINSRLLTLQYCVLQGAYWAAFCAIYAFSTILLLSKGFKSSQVGMMIALGNILGVILQPKFAGIADSSKNLSLQKLTALIAAVTVCLFLPVYFLSDMIPVIAVCFLLTVSFLQVIQPLVNSVSVYYVNRGVSVDFGVSRGVGSLSYAAVSSVLGYLVTARGANIIVLSGLLFLVFIAFTLLSMPILKQDIPHDHATCEASKDKTSDVPKESLLHFFIRYKGFTITVIGCTLLFTFHNLTNSYMIQIVQSLGGDSSNMGMALSIAGLCEIPVMLLFSRLLKHFNSSRLLIISGVFFAIKAAAYLLAGNIPQFYLTQVLQMGSFALYVPASVYYTNETMDDSDKFMGQAVMTSSNTLGGVIGSLLGGFLLDYANIRLLLFTGFLLSAGGAFLLFCSCRVRTLKNKR